MSLSLLSYAAALAQNMALDNESLLALNILWFITGGSSLFIAGSTGLAAAISGNWDAKSSPDWIIRILLRCQRVVGCLRLGPNLGRRIVSVVLLISLFAMVTGFVLLANGVSVNTPLGNTHLPPAAISPILVIAIVVMILVSFLMIGAHGSF